jgi:hypothetical protein
MVWTPNTQNHVLLLYTLPHRCMAIWSESNAPVNGNGQQCFEGCTLTTQQALETGYTDLVP